MSPSDPIQYTDQWPYLIQTSCLLVLKWFMYFNVFTNLYITYLFLQTYAQSTLTKKGRKTANMAYGCPQLLYLYLSIKHIDNKPSHWVLPPRPSHWNYKSCKCVLVRCRNKVIKTGKRSKFILIIICLVRTTANVAAMCAIVTIMIAQYTFQ